MYKYILPLVIGVLISLSSCKKCKECYIDEGIGTTNQKTTSLGEKCGDEIDQIDGKNYTGNDGPVRTYCN